jgi:hypothetical protein
MGVDSNNKICSNISCEDRIPGKGKNIPYNRIENDDYDQFDPEELVSVCYEGCVYLKEED